MVKKVKLAVFLWYATDLYFYSPNTMDDSIAEAKAWFSKLASFVKRNSEVIHSNLDLLYRLDYDDGLCL